MSDGRPWAHEHDTQAQAAAALRLPPTVLLGNTRWKASPELPSLAPVRVAWCHDVMLGGPNGLRGMAAGARQRAVEAGPEQNDGDGEPRC